MTVLPSDTEVKAMNAYSFYRKSFFLVITLLLASCATRPPPTEIDVPIVQGWLPSYDSLVRSEITPEMMQVHYNRMKDFCPEWNKLGPDQKRDFYANLVQAVAWAESGYDSASMYVEDKLGKDQVTGQNVVSEGLMQLSYQDKTQYGDACDFHYEQDKADFLADLGNNTKGSLRSKHLHRRILNPQANLTCAMAILQKLLTSSSKPVPEVFAPYWSTLNSNHPRRYAHVIDKMRSESSFCTLPIVAPQAEQMPEP